jgi:nucleoid-associated protein YgaU
VTNETKLGLFFGLMFLVLMGVLMGNGVTTTEHQPADFEMARADAGGTTDDRLNADNAGRVAVNDGANTSNSMPFRPQAINHPYHERMADAEPRARGRQGLPEIPRDAGHELNRDALAMNDARGRDALGRDAMGLEAAGPMSPPTLQSRRDAHGAVPVVPPAIQTDPPTERRDRRPDPSVVLTDPLSRDNLDLVRDAPPATTVAARMTYEIRSRDSLAKIARKAYGTESPSVIDAIYQANRDVLKAPDKIREGQTIVLPPIKGIENRLVAAGAGFADRGPTIVPNPIPESERAQSARSKPTDVATTAKPTFREYTVRDNESLSKIASRELGDSSRFLEIFQLNRDILKSPDKIRSGMKLKMPPKERIRSIESRPA